MSQLVDSDWIIDYLRGRQAAVRLLTDLARDSVGMSLITYGEVFEGIYYGTNPADHEAALIDLVKVVEVVGLDETILRRFALIRGDLRRRGQLIADADVLIAATALHYDLTLVTRNRRDFERIPGLRLYQADTP